MKGKFRKRSEAVWCPKPKEKIDWDLYRRQENDLYKQFAANKIDHDTLSKKLEELRSVEKIPRKKVVCTGWVNMLACRVCEYLEEFDLDNNGVFCLYGVKKK